MKKSQNTYDWLGHGIYFWENNYHRALEWAKQSSKIKEPAVIGAVIDLGYCLNLTENGSAEYLRRGFEILKTRSEQSGTEMPKNKPSKKCTDILQRDLDCAVIQQIHDYNRTEEKRPFDSVRGVFVEGKPAYEGSAFMEKTHIQLCIVNPNCIKGFFTPRISIDGYSVP